MIEMGDTGEDIRVGKALKIKTCAVLSGFMNEKKLLGYNPDVIRSSVVGFCA